MSRRRCCGPRRGPRGTVGAFPGAPCRIPACLYGGNDCSDSGRQSRKNVTSSPTGRVSARRWAIRRRSSVSWAFSCSFSAARRRARSLSSYRYTLASASAFCSSATCERPTSNVRKQHGVGQQSGCTAARCQLNMCIPHLFFSDSQFPSYAMGSFMIHFKGSNSLYHRFSLVRKCLNPFSVELKQLGGCWHKCSRIIPGWCHPLMPKPAA